MQLIAAICWAAAVIRKKVAESKILEQQVRTLGLKNEALDAVISAQKKQLSNIIDAEAESIIAKHYNVNSSETIERLKLSLNTISDLIDRGAKILPADENNNDVKKLFPDYTQLNTIESLIMQLKNSA